MSEMKRSRVLSLFVPVVFLLGFSGQSSGCEFFYNETGVDGANHVCTRLETTADIQIFYFDTLTKPAKLANTTFSLCNTTITDITGSCNEPTTRNNDTLMNLISLDWGENYTLEFNFTKDTSNKQWMMESIKLDVDTMIDTEWVNFTALATNHFLEKMDSKKAYKCKKQTVKFKVFDYYNSTRPSMDYNVTLTLSHIKIQAFDFDNYTNGDFGQTLECSQDVDVALVASTAAAAAVVLFIMVILVAFLVGKLRNRKQTTTAKGGYEPISS